MKKLCYYLMVITLLLLCTIIRFTHELRFQTSFNRMQSELFGDFTKTMVENKESDSNRGIFK